MEFINTCFETTNEVRSLALYSHLLPIFVGLILSYIIIVKAKAREDITFFILFLFTLSLWLAGDLIAWHSDNYFLVASLWSTLDYINTLFFLLFLCFFILHLFRHKKYSNLIYLLSFLLLLLPLLLTFAGIAVLEFDEPNCEMISNHLITNYNLFVEIFVLFSILLFGLVKILIHKINRKQTLLLTLSSFIFLSLFAFSDYIATVTTIYEINLYTLFTLPIFFLIISMLVLNDNVFQIKIDSYELAKFLFLIFAIVAVFSLVLTDDMLEFGVAVASTVVTIGFGLLLLRSTKKEIKQREEIQKLAGGLEKANNRLRQLDKQKSEFVSIASHQLRSPLTAMRGYASMMAEGSYGPITDKQRDVLLQIQDSGKMMASSIEDYLSISRIESGNMKYEMSEFNLKELTEHLTEELQSEATKLGLILHFTSELDGEGVVNADKGKTFQIIHNLVNNSIKYTPKGTITVLVKDDPVKKCISVNISDTGIGMSQVTLEKLFEKFSRASNANQTNIKGTGLGLYVARSLAHAMQGEVSAASEGEGKGSTFTFTLPYVR